MVNNGTYAVQTHSGSLEGYISYLNLLLVNFKGRGSVAIKGSAILSQDVIGAIFLFKNTVRRN